MIDNFSGVDTEFFFVGEEGEIMVFAIEGMQ